MWTAPQLEARLEEIARHQHDGSLRSALLERLNSLLPQRAVSINEFNATKRLIVNPGGEPFVYDQKLTPYDRAINDACDHIDVRVIAVKGSVRSSKTLSAESLLMRNPTYAPPGNILWFMQDKNSPNHYNQHKDN